MHTLDINGDPPSLRGKACEAFLCEPFEYAGVVEATANVSHLRFDGQWHRLYFDCGVIFWRRSDESPQSWPVDEDDRSDPLTDVGEQAGVIGVALTEYLMEPTQKGARVVFEFANGRRVIVEDHDDRSDYCVV